MTKAHTARTISSLKPLFVTGAVSAVLTMIARYYFQYENIEDDVGIWGGFFTVFGVIYAIVAGFLLVEVLGRYSTLSNTIEAELNAVECLRDYLVYLDDDQNSIKSEIRSSLKSYLISVRDEEWPAMSEEDSFVDSDTSDELYAVMRAVKGIVSHADIDGVVLGSLVEKISDTTVQRTLTNFFIEPAFARPLTFFASVHGHRSFDRLSSGSSRQRLGSSTDDDNAGDGRSLVESDNRRSGSSVLRRLESEPRSFGSTYRAARQLTCSVKPRREASVWRVE